MILKMQYANLYNFSLPMGSKIVLNLTKFSTVNMKFKILGKSINSPKSKPYNNMSFLVSEFFQNWVLYLDSSIG